MTGEYSLQDNDPMKGYYDRIVEEGGEKEILCRNFIRMFCAAYNIDIGEQKRYFVENGYGSSESMEKLLPSDKEEKK